MLSFFVIFVTFLPASVLSCAATSAVTTPTTTLTCATCANAQVLTRAAAGEINPTITQTAGTNASGCRTITVTCANPGGNQVFFFWEEDGANRGTSTDGTTTVTRTLVCDSNGELVLTEPGPPPGNGIVNAVECLAAA
uniref:C6 domain-containing protein n=1 Tax=Panagrolaimus sp. PS1159 TaxID=55785 RepID=A0AC35GC23_9BILA